MDDFAAEQERSFPHLSITDLLAAREQYHVFLTKHPNVVATAIGRYLTRHRDVTPLADGEKAPRTLFNSSVNPRTAWPCVLVFVERWQSEAELIRGSSPGAVVPKTLYLPDGRAVPVCIVLAPRVLEDKDAGPAAKIRYPRSVIGGGFPLKVTAQGVEHEATFGCLVTDGGRYFAITNRHVTGAPGRPIMASLGGEDVEVGVAASSDLQLSKLAFAEVYPGWPGAHLFINADIGLVEIHNLRQWRTDIFQLGPIAPLLDLNINTLNLETVGRSVSGFGAGSGPIYGQIAALFYRYRALGGLEYVADFLIGPAVGSDKTVQHGDSGAVLLMEGARNTAPRPFAIVWGAHDFVGMSGRGTLGFALATSLGNVCRLLDVDLVRGWNLDQPYTWGKTGHFKIGFSAADFVTTPALKHLLSQNQDSLGYSNQALLDGDVVKGVYTEDFVPLADVADIIWRSTRHDDQSNHFCDIDEADPQVAGGKTLLELSLKDDANIDIDVWLDFDRQMDRVRPVYKTDKNGKQTLQPRLGALPFRVWEMYLQMIHSLQAGAVDEFLVAGGTMAHYVGDACQPLHISYLHHGADPSESGVHEDYETQFIDHMRKPLFERIDALATPCDETELISADGKAAAKSVLKLMKRTVDRLSPEEILQVWRVASGRTKWTTMWDALGKRTAATIADGAHTMAVLWESAWEHGRGAAIPSSKIRVIKQDRLKEIYMTKTFCQSFKLSDVAGYKSVLEVQ